MLQAEQIQIVMFMPLYRSDLQKCLVWVLMFMIIWVEIIRISISNCEVDLKLDSVIQCR